MIRHDFHSDTQTRPGRAMLASVLDAPLGDEQLGEDPTTRRLEERVAELLGKEAAVFLPSGTMCNEIAIAVHCRPGDAVICARRSHVVTAEGGGPAALAGVMVHPLDDPRGILDPGSIRAAIAPQGRYAPRSRLLCVEQTVNREGGVVWPVAALDAAAGAARGAGLATHMDGARLMNAVVRSGVPAARMAAGYDSVWLDFTKGLGAPIGAVLAGSRDFVAEAWRLKQRWGGAMRQSGVAAAMCLYALDNNVERLAEDHALAGRIAAAIADLPGVARILPVETNIVIFETAEGWPDAPALLAALARDGIRISAFGPRLLRAVTHLDVGPRAAEALVAALARHLGPRARA
ncbi:MAG: low specificity L-threonine aldolase [Alphaproteobacteria bacterium]|nr:MAG: low specificity L-threonine aldolase [Alphaproteobacteria bacterium]